MQPQWTSRAGKCLFCSIRPRLLPFTSIRPFTSTTALSGQLPKRKPKHRSRQQDSPKNFKLSEEKFFDAVENVLSDMRNSALTSSLPQKEWDSFSRRIIMAARLQNGVRAADHKLGSIKSALLQAWNRAGPRGVREELRALHMSEQLDAKYAEPHHEQQLKAADLQYPAEWYPHTRSRQRKIHLHVGPTNSGKTYNALKRLEQADRGFYAGPLRLLAQEVYSRFTAEGVPCALVTGDEVRVPPTTPRITSNTVEMVSISNDFDVGVIDEIQMIADPDRGWAWTRAVMGCKAQELHLCGEARAVPLITELATLMGDVLEVHQYQRLNPLRAESTSLKNDFSKLRKGDCLVAFSRLGIHAMKNEIEMSTGKRAAIVYGGLPAEIRTQQANLFNDPDNDYDFLVASDAIGMGLNLKCKRIIFQTLIKRTGDRLARLTIPEIKQIAGRAGRYRAANEKEAAKGENVGLVTCLEEVDLPYIKQALEHEPVPIKAAGTVPPDNVFKRIAPYFPPDVSFKYIVNHVLRLTRIAPLFFVCDGRHQLENAEIIDRCDFMNLDDRLTFMSAPIYSRKPEDLVVVKGLIRAVANNTSGRLLDIPEINLEVLESPVSGNKDYMHELESLHKSLILYLWLSYRLGGVFTDRTLATHVKSMVEERMIRALSEFSANKKLRRDASLHRQIQLERQTREQERLLSAMGGNKDPSNPDVDDMFDMPAGEQVEEEVGEELEEYPPSQDEERLAYRG